MFFGKNFNFPRRMQKIILIMDTWPNILALSTRANKNASLIQFDSQLGPSQKSINLQFSESLLIEHLHFSLHLVDWRINLLLGSLNNEYTNWYFKQEVPWIRYNQDWNLICYNTNYECLQFDLEGVSYEVYVINPEWILYIMLC